MTGNFTTLAENEQWLADNYGRTVHTETEDGAVGEATLATEEEHILRYLGAALIMQWNALKAPRFPDVFASGRDERYVRC